MVQFRMKSEYRNGGVLAVRRNEERKFSPEMCRSHVSPVN